MSKGIRNDIPMIDREGWWYRVKNVAGKSERNCKSLQELWAGLRGFAVVNCVRCQSGLFRDAEDFCFVVFDCLEPNVSKDGREQRMTQVGAIAVPLNLRIVAAGRRLTASDNAFLVKWNIAVGTSMVAMWRLNPDVGLILSAFASFDSELRLVDDPKLVLAVWLYSLYTTIYASAFGTIPAGVLGVAALGIGLAAA